MENGFLVLEAEELILVRNISLRGEGSERDHQDWSGLFHFLSAARNSALHACRYSNSQGRGLSESLQACRAEILGERITPVWSGRHRGSPKSRIAECLCSTGSSFAGA